MAQYRSLPSQYGETRGIPIFGVMSLHNRTHLSGYSGVGVPTSLRGRDIKAAKMINKVSAKKTKINLILV